MNSRERYREVHEDYMNAMYELFLTDAVLWGNIHDAATRVFSAAYDFGAEEALKADSVRRNGNV